MDAINRDRIIGFIDRMIFILFFPLIIFIPISNSGIEISFACIFLFVVARNLILPPSFEDIKEFLSDKINLSVLIFFICIGMSFFASGPLLSKSIRAWISKWGEGVALFYIARTFLSRKQIRTLLLVFVGVTLLVGVDGFYQKLTGVDFLRGFEPNTIRGVQPVKASFSHHNDFATFLIVMLFINMGILDSLKKTWQKIVAMAIIPVIIINIVYTYSRGAWLALLVVLIFLIFFIPEKKTKVILISLITAFLICLFVTPILRERFMFILQKGGDSGRYWRWQAAISIFKDSPLIGCGLGLFMDIFYKYTKAGYHYAHNCYLQMLAETGLIGFMSFMWMMGCIFFTSLKVFKQELDKMSLGIFAGLTAFLIYAFFDTQFYSLKLSILFWLITAFLVGSLKREKV